ncbi:MAG: formate dehydrogenase subunit gamma, partial [Comamonadaceae bacterium]
MHPSPSRPDAVLATPDQLRDRIRQLGKGVPRKDDPRLAHVRAILAGLGQQQGALLPVLHAVQDTWGCVPPELVPEIADGLNLSRAEVHGVVTYYHHFRSEPAGRHVLEVCRAEACQAMGGEALWHDACSHAGLSPDGGRTADGALSVEPVYCLGLCAQSPAAMLDGR